MTTLCARQADLSSYLRRMEDEVCAAEAELSQRAADTGARSRRSSVAHASDTWLSTPHGVTSPRGACASPERSPGCAAGGRPASACIRAQRPGKEPGPVQKSSSVGAGKGSQSREQLHWAAQRPATASASARPAGEALRGCRDGATAAAGAKTLPGCADLSVPPKLGAALGDRGVSGCSPSDGNTAVGQGSGLAVGPGQGLGNASASPAPAKAAKSERVLRSSSTWSLLRDGGAAAEECPGQVVVSRWGLRPESASSSPVPTPKSDSILRRSAFRNTPEDGNGIAEDSAGSVIRSGWGLASGSASSSPAQTPKAERASRGSRTWRDCGAAAGQGAGPPTGSGPGLRPGSAHSALSPQSERALRGSMPWRSPPGAGASALQALEIGLGPEQGARPRSASSSPASTITLRLSAFNPMASPVNPVMSPAKAAAVGSEQGEFWEADDGGDSMSVTVLLASPVHGEPHMLLLLLGTAHASATADATAHDWQVLLEDAPACPCVF